MLLPCSTHAFFFADSLPSDQGVQLCSDALLNIQDFLGRFLVKEFDHEANRKLETYIYILVYILIIKPAEQSVLNSVL